MILSRIIIGGSSTCVSQIEFAIQPGDKALSEENESNE